ncbi:GTP-binding protein Obg/CgtA [Sesbania bispinosa]|nr:GTP-binding protein Obg/CgtA [Sesbania bispinosa]
MVEKCKKRRGWKTIRLQYSFSFLDHLAIKIQEGKGKCNKVRFTPKKIPPPPSSTMTSGDGGGGIWRCVTLLLR